MIASNLTVSQRRALDKLVYRVWKSAYNVQETRGTLDSLVNKGLAERNYSWGLASQDLSVLAHSTDCLVSGSKYD